MLVLFLIVILLVETVFIFPIKRGLVFILFDTHSTQLCKPRTWYQVFNMKTHLQINAEVWGACSWETGKKCARGPQSQPHTAEALGCRGTIQAHQRSSLET